MVLNFVRVLYLIEGSCCWLFFYFSQGLIFYDDQAESYSSVRNLYSSGSQDDVAIWILGFVNMLTFLVLLLKRYNQKHITVIIIIGAIFQLASLILIQVGSVILTIFIDGNLFLVGAFLSQLLIFTMWIRGFFNPKIRSKI